MKYNNLAKLQEFVKFKKSQSFTSTVNVNSSRSKNDQPDLDQLKRKNNDKQHQLFLYQKQYEKLNKHVKQVLYQLKNEQDIVENQLLNIQKNRKSQQQQSYYEIQRFQELQEQLQLLRKHISEQKDNQIRKQRQHHERMQKQIKMMNQIQQNINQHEEWLTQSQRNTTRLQPLDLKSIKIQSQELRKNNEIITKELAIELKRFKRECEDVKKLVKQQSQKLQQRIKNWIKKLDAVIDNKKQLRDIVPDYSIEKYDKLKSIEDVEQEYKIDLQTIGSLYPSDLKKQLAQVLQIYQLRNPTGLTMRNSIERYNVTDLELEIKRIDDENKKTEQEVRIRGNQIEGLNLQIQKYEKLISQIKSNMQLKKRK